MLSALDEQHLESDTGAVPSALSIQASAPGIFGAVSTHFAAQPPARPGYACEECHYTSKTKSALAAHYRTHTGEKPFNCNYQGCGYAAAERGALIVHTRRKHTGEKPYKCDQPGCGYAAVDSGSLRGHKRIHTQKASPSSATTQDVSMQPPPKEL